MGRPAFRRVLALVRRLFMPLALAALAIAAWSAQEVFASTLVHARPGGIATAIAIWAALNALVPAIATVWLRALGAPVGYPQLLSIHLGRLPARYLPGGVWHTVARITDLDALGIGRPRLASLVLLENAVPLAVALLIGGCAAAIAGTVGGLWAVVLILGFALLLVPLATGRLPARLPAPAFGTYLVGVAMAVVFWLVALAAFASYWYSFPQAGTSASLAEVASAYLLGWAAGFLAVFAPQGIGVFEAVAATQLRGPLPLASTAVVLVGFRVVTIAGDLLAFCIGWIWRRRQRWIDTSGRRSI